MDESINSVHSWTKFLEQQYAFFVENISSMDSLYRKGSAKRVQTSKGIYVLKSFSGTPEQLIELYRKIQILRKMNSFTVPDWILTEHRDPYIRRQGKLYYMVTFEEGCNFSPTPANFYALGQTLRLLHQSTQTLCKMSASSLLKFRLKRLNEMKKTLDLHINRQMDDEMEEWWQAHRAYCYTSLSVAKQELTEAIQQNQTIPFCSWVHGDVTSLNVIMDGQKAKLIDWERVGPGFSCEELAKTAANTCLFETKYIASLWEGYDFWQQSKAEQKVFSASFRIPREVVYLQELIRKGRRKQAKELFSILRTTWDHRVRSVLWIEEALALAGNRIS